jgi:hypothetical protein
MPRRARNFSQDTFFTALQALFKKAFDSPWNQMILTGNHHPVQTFASFLPLSTR